MKLNLGCGQLKYAGWVNVDSRPSVKPDVVADIMTYLVGLDDGVISAVRMEHVLEHLSWPNAQRLIPLLFCKMNKGATIALETPDLLKCLKQLQKNPSGGGAIANIFGHYAVKGEVEHRWGYTEALLTRLLKGAGFVDVREDDKKNYAHPRLGLDRDIRVVGKKP